MTDSVNNSRCKFYFSFLVRLIFLVHHLGVIVYGGVLFFKLIDNDNEAMRQPALFAPGYGTNWNFIFQTVFLCLALTYDVLEWVNKNESNFGTKLRYVRDVMFSSIVFPFTLFVTSMFWTLYWIDRELIFPKVYDEILPAWFNHCVHTNITVVILIETLLQPRRYPVNKKLEWGLNILVTILYSIVYFGVYFFGNRWLYGVYGIMNWWQICLFQLLVWASIFFFHAIHYPFNRLIHGSEEEKHIEQDTRRNGVTPKMEMPKNINTDLLTPPFSTKSWRLKYRSIRDQFENSRL